VDNLRLATVVVVVVVVVGGNWGMSVSRWPRSTVRSSTLLGMNREKQDGTNPQKP
jgi:hypothetical protein